MYTTLVLVVALLVTGIVCPPVKDEQKPQTKEEASEEAYGLAYEQYLKEVVSTLESDPEFKKKLKESNTTDIQNGAIANHLEFVNHNVRTKLDELKRLEVQRLTDLIRQKTNIERGVPMHHQLNELVGHIDKDNPNTFEIDDLSRLIKKATGDLDDIDKKRRGEYKEYEMEKKLKEEIKLKRMNVADREIEVKRVKEMEAKHNDHKKLNHPGSKDQLEELWQGEGYDKDNFDPKTFFLMHDMNGDGFLDESEVEGLFQKELDKLYDSQAPEDDQRQRYEEMERMREHLMNEIDKDSDKMISMSEFIESTKKSDFLKNEGWEDLEDKEDEFSNNEFDDFQKEYLAEHKLNSDFEPIRDDNDDHDQDKEDKQAATNP